MSWHQRGMESEPVFLPPQKHLSSHNRAQIGGKISLSRGQRQEAPLKSLATPPPLISYCDPESSGDRYAESNNRNTKKFKDGEARH